MKYKRILVVGGLGFIGFNAVQKWLEKFDSVVVADDVTDAAYVNLIEKQRWIENNNVKFVKVDISTNHSRIVLGDLIQKDGIDVIVNFAAESHVDNSIDTPIKTFDTNVMGTVNLLELARRYDVRYHQVSTDEVYGITTEENPALESGTLSPSSPYSASKCAADMSVISYVKTYGIYATISRCSNNFGPWQHPEKLLPKSILKCFDGLNIPLYGDGGQKRHWIHVDCHNDAILDILENGESGRVYNIAPGANSYVSNKELVETVISIVRELNGKCDSKIEYVKDRPAHDTSYYIKSETGYVYPSHNFIEKLVDTVEWYRENIHA